jgi:hypothetical protein
MSPAQNTTDKFFESIIITVYPGLASNNTLDEFSYALVKQLESMSSYPELEVVSPLEKTILGGIPAYNMTYTYTPPKDLDPPALVKPVVMQIWTVKDNKGYVIGYMAAEGQINPDIDNVAKRVIDSFELLPSRQSSTSRINLG